MSLACPGSCRGIPGDPFWCSDCSRIIRTALRGLPEAYEALKSVHLLTRTQPADAVRVSGSRERPSPAPGVDLMDELYHSARSWENAFRTTLKVRAARDGAAREETLGFAVHFLNREFDRVMGHSLSVEFGVGVQALFSRCLFMVKNGPMRAHLRIPCHYCQRRTLMQREGIAGRQWYTVCEERLGGCGRLFTETEMAWAAEVQAALAR